VSDDRIQNAEREAHRGGEEGESEPLVRLSRSLSLVCAVLATHSQEMAGLKVANGLLDARLEKLEREHPSW
jgi:hypothetical protein